MVGIVLRKACEDVLPTTSDTVPTTIQRKEKSSAKTDNADSYLKPSSKSQVGQTSQPRWCSEARDLILTILTKVPADAMSKSLRRELDRTAILCKDDGALLASVLNSTANSAQAPAPSLLPFLAREQPQSLSTEAILRPRFPFVRDARLTIASDDTAESNHEFDRERKVDFMSHAFDRSIAGFPERGDPAAYERFASTIAVEQRDNLGLDTVSGSIKPADAPVSLKRKYVDEPTGSNPSMNQIEKRPRTANGVEASERPASREAEDTVPKHADQASDTLESTAVGPPAPVSTSGNASQDVDANSPTQGHSSAGYTAPTAFSHEVNRQLVDNDADSSGSDIPMINLDLSTEDEEDEEEEKEIEVLT